MRCAALRKLMLDGTWNVARRLFYFSFLFPCLKIKWSGCAVSLLATATAIYRLNVQHGAEFEI
jgi:hypothetical protein